MVIDFERLGQRIQSLPIKPALYQNLQIAKTGQLVYLKNSGAARLNSTRTTILHCSG